MKKTFSTGDCVIYKNKGVCRIEGTETRDFGGDPAEYYILTSVRFDEYKSYVPVNSDAAHAMKMLPSEAEINEMIINSLDYSAEYETDKKKRAQLYARIKEDGDICEMIGMHRLLNERKAQGIKMLSADINLLMHIEKNICEIFSYILDIPSSDVGDYIKQKLSQAE